MDIQIKAMEDKLKSQLAAQERDFQNKIKACMKRQATVEVVDSDGDDDATEIEARRREARAAAMIRRKKKDALKHHREETKEESSDEEAQQECQHAPSKKRHHRRRKRHRPTDGRHVNENDLIMLEAANSSFENEARLKEEVNRLRFLNANNR